MTRKRIPGSRHQTNAFAQRKLTGIREIAWGMNEGDGGTCIYTLGHIEKQEFLDRARACSLDTPPDALEDLTVSDVKHLRFRPMSPTEARGWGCDSGVRDCTGEDRGYPVTAVTL